MIDTHCHFDFPPFSDDVHSYLLRAKKQGVDSLVVPAVTVSNWDAIEQLSHAFPDIYYGLGLHPVWDNVHQETDIDLLAKKLADKPERLLAIGECGLDFSIQDVDKESQLIRLSEQFELAVNYDLPVILHCRQAHNELLKRINAFPRLRGVLHGSSGSEEL